MIDRLKLCNNVLRLLVVLPLLGLIGCVGSIVSAEPVVLPTMEQVAQLPTVAVGTAVPIPPTFTPDGFVAPPSVTPEPTQPPSPTATVVKTAVATPFTIPQIVTAPANAPEIETSPDTVACLEDGLLFRTRFPSDVGGPTRAVHIYLPPCYGEDAFAYPVLYLFHGSIQNDTHWPDLGLGDILDAQIKAGNFPPFIAVMPDNGAIGNNTSGNTDSIEGITLNALMPFIESNFCSWNEADGRGIGGISRGGYWALMIAFRNETLFRSVSGHSSQLRLDVDSEQYNPLVTYAAADFSNLRVWLDWGETDFLRLGQSQLRQSLEEVDVDLTASVNPGGHNERYWLTHLPDYLAWHAAAWPTEREAYPVCALGS